MKEQFQPVQGDLIPIKSGLTNQAQNPYSKGGPRFNRGEGNFMAEPGQPEVQAPAISQTPERLVRQLTSQEARLFWERFEHSRGGLSDVQIARREESISGRTPLSVGVNKEGEFQIPGVDTQNLIDNQVLREIRYINQLHDLQELNVDKVLNSIKNLMDLREQAKEELGRATDPLQQGIQQNRIDQINLAIQRMGDYIRAEGGDKEEHLSRYFTPSEEKIIMEDPEERERIFEQIFVGVDANPGVEFQQALSLDQRERYSVFMSLLDLVRVNRNGNPIADAVVLTKERERLKREFSGRFEIRSLLHNANYSVAEGGGDIQRFVNEMSTFKAEYVDLIFSDPLVETALHMFEQAFQQIRAKNGGRLPYEELAWDYKRGSSKLEDLVWNLMRRVIASQNIPEWRLRRSIILARGFGIVSLRFPEIAAEARLPEEGPLTSAEEKAGRLASIYGESIARYLDPLEHIIEKFSIGEEDRAFLYYFLTGEKAQFQSTQQLRDALDMKSKLEGKDKRLIDVINLFKAGGPFSFSSWRVFMAMKGMTEEQKKRAGLGMREARISGDIDDGIIDEVKRRMSHASETEIAKEVERVKNKEKDERIFEARLKMWQDATESNPLRIMWEWEKRNPGQRVCFLKSALEITEDEARSLLPQVEEDLMVIQEEYVSLHKVLEGLGEEQKANPALIEDPIRRAKVKRYISRDLKFDVVEDPVRRKHVQSYVQKIRQEASNDEWRFLRKMLSVPKREFASPFPFFIGMDDVPFSDLDFIKGGGRAMARRFNDYAGAVTAATELTNLISAMPVAQSIEPLLEILTKTKAGIASYDMTIAKDVLVYLEEGIIRMYDKELLARLPLGIGSIVSGMKDSSFAQVVFGREAMSWDEADKFNFTRQLLQKGLLRKKDMPGLRKRVGATYPNMGVYLIRTYGQLLLLYLAFEFAKKIMEEKK